MGISFYHIDRRTALLALSLFNHFLLGGIGMYQSEYCQKCEGEGRIKQEVRQVWPKVEERSHDEYVTCPRCGGSGKSG